MGGDRLTPSQRQAALPHSPPGLPREMVADNPRQRLLTGVARAMAIHSYADLTVEQVLIEAGVSRATFYANFENKRTAVLVAHEEAFGRLMGEIVGACALHEEWPAKVRAATAAAIATVASGPEEARLLVLDSVAAEPALVTKVLASYDFLVALLRNGREYQMGVDLPELTERALVGAVTSVIGTRVLSGQTDQLPDLEPQLVQLLLMPYVGTEEAKRIAYGETG